MAALLRELLPKVYPEWVENVHWIPIYHNGKSDLEASIRRKLRAWREPGVRFVIMRDNDGGDCRERKAHLRSLANERSIDEVLIRIVCQELEGWFLGDLAAVKAAFTRAPVDLSRMPAKYRDPDLIGNAADELAHLTGTKAKVSRAAAIAEHMNPPENRSSSFQVFLAGLDRLTQTESETN